MTSTHCTDCPYHDSNNPSYCCSNAIMPKPTDDYDDRALQKAADHVDAIKRCKAKPVRRKTKPKPLVMMMGMLWGVLVIGSIARRYHDYAVKNDVEKFDLKNGNDTPNAYKVACAMGLLRYV